MKLKILSLVLIIGFGININAQTQRQIAIRATQEIQIETIELEYNDASLQVAERELTLQNLREINDISTEIQTILNADIDGLDIVNIAVSLQDVENSIKNLEPTVANIDRVRRDMSVINERLKDGLIMLSKDDGTLAHYLDDNNNQNYIRTRTYTSANGTYLTKTQYYDGLGRPNELVLKKITPDPNPKDLVSYIEYDHFGREFKQWLPAKVEQNNGNFVAFTNFETAANSMYSDDRPFVETLYENSPLSRVIGQRGAGADWANHPSKIAYAANAASEVPYFEVANNQLKRDGFYSANTLFKTVATDEDGKTATEFKDKLGRVVMTMQSTDHKTCYVYDDFGLLRYVLPPLATDALTLNGTFPDTNSKLDEYAYIYKYDERGNQIYKKLPGCEPIFMVYDKANRLVLSQSGNQRTSETTPSPDDKWIATTYDIFGRILYTCEIINGQSHNSLLTYYKTRLVVEKFDATKPFGYTTNYFPQYGNLLIVNYYDNYNFLNLLESKIKISLGWVAEVDYDHPSPIISQTEINAKGLLTGTRAYILDDSGEFLTTAFYYDKKGQIVQQRATNHLQQYDFVYHKYNFTGTIAKTSKEHSSSNSGGFHEVFTYTYDHAQRLTRTEYSLNEDPPIVIAENIYDDLGRLIEKKRHDNTDTENFEYNIKSWLTKIQSGDFEQNLSYTGLYNGNISSMAIKNDNGNGHQYIFLYDELNRLTGGVANLNSKFSVNLINAEGFTYDKHGNITHLTRYSGTTKIDDLQMEYDGNQLKNIQELAKNHILTGQNTLKEYIQKGDGTFIYDDNGNLIKDSDREIENIEYNVLNLPNKVLFKNGNAIVNIYAADSRKLSSYYTRQTTPQFAPKEATTANLLSRVQTATATRAATLVTSEEITGTHYVGNFEYLFDKNDNTETVTKTRIHNAEGYFSDNNYFYYRTDHLGNNREVWNASTQQTVQRNNYYPSGLPWKYETENLESPYMYNGKEFVEMDYDTYDYGARGYYAAIGRFMSVDPLAEDYNSVSPYAYCLNNFMKFIAPDGRKVVNSDSVPMVQAEMKKDDYEKKFNEKKEALKGLDKKGVDKNSKQYKDAVKAVAKAEKSFKAATEKFNEKKANYEITKARIDYFKCVFPELFKQLDNIVINGKEINVYVFNRYPTENNKYGQTRIGTLDDKSAYTGFKIYIQPGLPADGNYLAHEFGHVYQLVTDGIEWYNKYFNSGMDCRDPNNYDYPQVKTSIDWENNFDASKKDCQKLMQGGN